MSAHNSTLKDVFDRVAATALALPLLPVMAGLAVVSKVKYGNAFHPCDKVGRDGEHFNMFKFKTMYDAVDANGNILPDKERRTRIGRFMRTTSLDELPQLFNVIAGDMSLVGPRPQCQSEIDITKNTTQLNTIIYWLLSQVLQVLGRLRSLDGLKNLTKNRKHALTRNIMNKNGHLVVI